MTPIEIAYFKHFMFDKRLERSFNYYYKTRRIKGSPSGDKYGNPEKIEEYFLKTTVEDVIMNAFFFAPTNNNAQRITVTYDYWKDIDDKWQEYMRQNESNFSNDSWPMLRKSFAILRQNWDMPYYWKRENLESTEEVYKRMHIELPLPEFRWTHGYVPKKNEVETEEKPKNIEPKFKVGDTIKGSISGDEVSVIEVTPKGYFTDDDGFVELDRQDLWELVKEEDIPLVDFTDEEDDPLADFDFLDGVLPGNYRLKQNEASLNFYKSNKITFNRLDSKYLKKHGFKFARLAKSKSGEICLIFNNLKGANVTNIKYGKNNTNVTVNSADICGKIKLLFSLKDTYSILRVEKIQEKQEFIIYKLSKKDEN